MTSYIIRRIVQAVFVLILATFMIFCVMRLLPGDPILLFVSQDEYSRMTSTEEIDALRAKFGLDKSLPRQYVDWIWDVLHADLGESIFFGTTVREEIADALPVTLHLGIITFILAQCIGIPAGIICAVRRGKWVDTFLTVCANIGITAPVFWLGILMIYTEDLLLSTRQIVMPIICLLLFPISGTVRQTRSAMLETTRQDYIRTAYAKGLSERTVIFKHAIRNGIIPVVTLAGMGIPHIFGGQVLIETVFNIPGMGRLAVDALFSQDYAILMANLLVDISYGWIDPRVRYS
ncbi:MAG: ABC transporter permease [Deltaproteobacteria bacterium]|nr:ABC transporter permease [Deltaproteobacteria bacterium]